MSRCHRALVLIVSLALILGCARVPESGRRQLILIPQSVETNMGMQAFQQVLDEANVATGAQADLVRRVGERLAAVVPDNDYEWEFKLVDEDTVNAFALPGGKVVIYRGILPYCQTEAGLAVVMGHEIAHVIARHGAERMTQGVLVQGAAMGLDVALEANGVEASQRNLWVAALGMGSQLGVILPYSRTHEYEADELGLTYMARAGYDPAAAPEFWQRFADKPGQAPPELLSTHPHDEKRAAELRAQLPAAQRTYQQTTPRHGRGVRLDTVKPR